MKNPSFSDKAIALRNAEENAAILRAYAKQDGAFPREIAEAEAAERLVAKLRKEMGS